MAATILRGPSLSFLAVALGVSAPGLSAAAAADAATLPVPFVQEEYEPIEGFLRIGPEPERKIALTDRGHTLILPGGGADPVGVVVFLDGWRVSVSEQPGAFDREALARDVAILRITTGNPLDFYFDDDATREVARRIEEILSARGLAHRPIFLAGLSLAGTRALKLAVFLESTNEHPLALEAVAIVDAPLDMERMWAAEHKASRDSFHPAAADEGRWVTYLLEENLGGGPRESHSAYVAYSPFTHSAPGGGNAVHLKRLAVRAYHEPDVDWWIEHRRKSYYQMNSIDQASLINELRLLGNERAELVTTHASREGYESGATPHTWSFVDDGQLVEWFLAQVLEEAATGE